MMLRPIFSVAFLVAGGTHPALPAASVPMGTMVAARQDACEVPIRWQITEVDPRFGLDEGEAARAVRQAGMLWEAAAGRVLMFQESSEGIPVSFLFDERQQATQERQTRQSGIEEQLDRVARAEAEVDALRSVLARSRIVHDARVQNFEDLLAGLREMAEYWNQRGGAPPSEVERLRTSQTEVDNALVVANGAGAEVNGVVDEVNAATVRLNDEIAEANRAREELEERYPAMRVQSGEFIDTRRGLGRLTFSREQEIRIFHFEDWDHLLLVIAHELGHALGLEHYGVEGALMAEGGVAVPGDGIPKIPAADIELLRAACPDLVP